MTNIRVSEKHGVNPSIMTCFYCNKESTGIALLGRLPKDAEAPMDGGIFDMNPGPECEKFMKMGIIFISVRDGELDKLDRDLELAKAQYSRDVESRGSRYAKRHPFRYMPNPHRTGGWVVISEEAIIHGIEEPMASHLLSQRWTFISDSNWDAMGFPPKGEEIDNTEEE